MRKKQLVYTIIITSLIIPNIIFGQETIVKGNENIEKLVEDVDYLLQQKYTSSNEYGDANSNTNSIYTINAGGEIIVSSFDLKLKIEEYILKETVLDIEIIDKGHKNENGEIVGREYSTYDRYQTSEELYQIYENHKNEKPIRDIEVFDKNNFKTNEKEEVEKILITLLNGQTVEINKGSNKLDFTKCIDKNGNRVNLTNIDITTSQGLSIAKAVVGFERAKELNYLKEFDIPSKVVKSVKVIEDGFIEEKDLNEFYNGSYSQKGKDFIGSLADKVFYYNGYKFNVNYDLLKEGTDDQKAKNNVSEIRYEDEKYRFDIYMNVVKDLRFYLSGNQNFKLSIYSNSQVKIADFRNDVINAIVNGNKGIVNREYDILAGNDRFETSVEVSKGYTKTNNANGVVLVGEDAVVDGLSAAPFAKYKNSPILLSKKDEIPKVAMDEIKRIFTTYDSVDTVYIIGGEDIISNEVYKQLVRELKNVRIIRISGKDRYETSINISSKMDLSKVSKAYVVSGYGEADAMSVAPLAVREGVPIIVSPKEKLSKDASNFIKENEGIVNVDVIGGRIVVDTEVMMDIKDSGNNRNNNKNISIRRVWGEDRQETNAMVLKMFKDNSEDRVVVAKDGMSKFSDLVDSMAAASLGYPVVLATDKLADEQVYTVDEIVKDDGSSKLIKVGNGISYGVIERLMDNM